MVKPGAVVIDVGNNWIEDATPQVRPPPRRRRRLRGRAARWPSAITPVPGGVGPMTIAMLLSNTVWLAERYGR